MVKDVKLGSEPMLWGSQKPEVRHIWAVRVITSLPLEGATSWVSRKGVNSDCCDCSAYIAESGANFLNIDKKTVHGEKCVQNCALKL
jgi:hypothetical protein